MPPAVPPAARFRGGATLSAMATASRKDPYDTPAMRQFTRFKAEHPGCVLFFRMGDFYEMFGEDAVEMSRVLGLTLSERPKGVALAGVPHHQKDNYLRRAINAGYRVAVCDQVQDPKDAKGVVDRAVTQVVTPGTLVDEDLIGDEPASVAAVLALSADRFAAAAVDLSTGRFALFDGPAGSLGAWFARLGVREVLVSDGDDGSARAAAESAGEPGPALTERAAWQFRADEALGALREQFGVASLEGFGLSDDDPAVPAAGAVVAYLRETQSVSTREGGSNDGGSNEGGKWAASGGEFQGQRRTLSHLRPPAREEEDGICRLDAVSLRALEVVRTIRAAPGTDGRGDRGGDGSLLGVFVGSGGRGSACLVSTAMGRRLLREWLCRPLSDAGAIRDRQGAVASFVEDRRAAEELGDLLGGMPDLARIAGRVSLGRATPRDLVALADGLARLPGVVELIQGTPTLTRLAETLALLEEPLGTLADTVGAACVDEAPATLRQGGLIRDGYDAELDEARGLQRDAGAWLAKYQTELVEQHDLPSLKVGFNKVFGYYIELPAAQARRAPDVFTRKQTLKNAERYITPELKTFEEKVTTAEDRALERERAIFTGLLLESARHVEEISAFADAVGELDVYRCFAEKATLRGWTRPEVVDEPVLEIEAGRHPVLDELLGERFVPNDAVLGRAADVSQNASLALITGPNMAGKSTFIRQTALLALLASVGSYVPADRAVIGACDRIFTRVGADDALHRGQSTFMVEMTETAAILHGCTDRSLVILDEIGRGTSTLDGLSLAWAIAERLAGDAEQPGPRTLFATHYHELTELEERLAGRVKNLHVQVREWPGADGKTEIVFVHRIGPGRADRSYGVHVARLAGVPEGVTRRAEEVLRSLSVQDGSRVETQKIAEAKRPSRGADQMGLFTEFLPHPAVDRLRELKLDALTPMQAFDVLRGLVEDAEER